MNAIIAGVGGRLDNICRKALSFPYLTYCAKRKYDGNLEKLHEMYLQAINKILQILYLSTSNVDVSIIGVTQKPEVIK